MPNFLCACAVGSIAIVCLRLCTHPLAQDSSILALCTAHFQGMLALSSDITFFLEFLCADMSLLEVWVKNGLGIVCLTYADLVE